MIKLKIQVAVLISASSHFLTARRWRFHIFFCFFSFQQNRDERLGLIIRHNRRRNGVHLETTLLLLLFRVEAQGTRPLQFQRWRRWYIAIVAIAEKLTCLSSRDWWQASKQYAIDSNIHSRHIVFSVLSVSSMRNRSRAYSHRGSLIYNIYKLHFTHTIVCAVNN